jgi:hypothetical protein
LPNGDAASIGRAPLAGLLGWLLPGLGHIYLGQRARGVVCLVTVTITFWTGVAIGGVQGVIDPQERRLWFVAQLCAGSNAGVGYLLHERLTPPRKSPREPVDRGPWASAEVGVHYTGVAGLLNLLLILDAIGRAERSPGRARERRTQTESSG